MITEIFPRRLITNTYRDKYLNQQVSLIIWLSERYLALCCFNNTLIEFFLIALMKLNDKYYSVGHRVNPKLDCNIQRVIVYWCNTQVIIFIFVSLQKPNIYYE